MPTRRATTILLIALSAACAACSSKVTAGADGDPAGGDAAPVTTCVPLGSSCAGGGVCCSGTCSVEGICSTGVTGCGATGATCRDNLDCCSFRCDGGVCSAEQCLDVGATCSSASECCTAVCTADQCSTIPDAGGCKVVGQACSLGSECCSTACPAGFCAPQASCRATDDLCFGDLDCCTSICSRNDGTPGACVLPPGGCGQGGMPCTNNSTCCTRICADPGTGATICLPASGCRMTGLACIDAQSCCGGGTNPNGTVSCVKAEPDDTFGRCDNGQACNPVGNICGATFILPDGSSYSVNASQNCCDGKQAVCKLDAAGIPRCFGGGSTECPDGYTGVPPCCIAEGELCQFRDQCCAGLLCLPDVNGVLRCGGSDCIPLGDPCDPAGGAPCCSGECLATGAGFACRAPDPTCAPNGAGCDTAADCCSGLCVNGVCGATTCQGEGDACTTDGDCCVGLTCIIPAGSLSGTCTTGGGCALVGQACSTANPCCPGSTCVISGTFTLCDDSAPCSCWAEDPV